MSVSEAPASRETPIVVLSLVEYYLPGFKAGGPLRTLQNMVDRLAGRVAFRIVTRDRDCGDDQPYPSLDSGRWYRVGGADVWYLGASRAGPRGLRRVLAGTPFDVLYLNSLFSTHFTLRPLLLRRAGIVARDRPVVLAPRGELHPGALTMAGWPHWVPRWFAARITGPRHFKKRCYIFLGRALGLFRGILWQASNEEEAGHIRAAMGRGARVHVAPDLAPVRSPARATPARPAKRAGTLRVMFLSRIDAKKNLLGAIEMLRPVRGAVEFDVYGPSDDAGYLAACRDAMETLPANITARFRGSLPHAEVATAFAGHDLFLFPTLGENFGHVILESLVQGCPVLTSDRTPWRVLQGGNAGWDLPLENVAAFTGVLQRCVDMEADEYERWSRGAAALGERHLRDETTVGQNRALFATAAGR